MFYFVVRFGIDVDYCIKGPNDLTWFHYNGRAIQYVIQLVERRFRMGTVCYFSVMLFHPVNGSYLGSTTDTIVGKSFIIHQQHMGIFRALIPLPSSGSISRMSWLLSIRNVRIYFPVNIPVPTAF